MEYSLAKELRDKGFIMRFCRVKKTCTHPGFEHPENAVLYHFPSLSELAKACEQLTMYFGLEKHSNDWRAGTLKQGGMNVQVSDSTPEGALARLWLKLKEAP